MPEKKAEKDSAIKGNLLKLEEYKKAGSILFFASFRSEVNTIPMIESALAQGKAVLLPKVNRKTKKLDIFEIKSIQELEKGFMGIPEPAELRPKKPGNADIILFPGAAFDLAGGRLGYGGGYYDKMLSSRNGKKAHLIALAYELQIEEKIPIEPHDIRVEKIVTEKRVINCNG